MLITAEIIAIGDEILIGQTLDTNSNWLAKRLSLYGVRLNHINVIRDDKTAINNAIDNAFTRANVIIVTGGLGPTKDDITKHTLCEYFNTELVLDEERLEELIQFYKKRGITTNDINKAQALYPKSCISFNNKKGTANGMCFEKKDKVLISLPGVPYEMKHLMETQGFDFIQNKFKTKDLLYTTVRTVGIVESNLAETLEDFENSIPENFSLAYLPSLGMVKLRITCTNGDKAKLASLKKQLVKLTEQYIYSEDDIDLIEHISNLLHKKNLTISTAESCTGGYIAHQFTSLSGSSSIFKGSIIAYSNEVKGNTLNVNPTTIKNFGAVSEQTVKEMAENGRKILNSDICVATSGIAGPTGGTEEKPVGTICIAISSPKETKTKTLQLLNHRDLNIKLTTVNVLNLIRKTLS